MKRTWAIGFGSLLAAGVVVAAPGGLAKPLAPGPDDAKIASIVVSGLVQQQYLHKKLDDAVSSQFLEQYLDALDPQHLFFLQSDLGEFDKWRTTLDDLTAKQGDTGPAYTIFTRLVERVEAQRQFVGEELKKASFAFEGADSFMVDRKKAERPKDLAEAQDLWRARLRYEYLQEKLNGQKPEEIVKTLTRRYDGTLRSLKQNDAGEVLEVYLTTLAKVFDPHTDYYGPSSFEDFQISMKLSLSGVGAVLRSEDGSCKVVEVVAGGPAGRSGQVKPGDEILAVAQGPAEPVDVVGMKLGKIVEMIRGAKGTEVRLTILPADAADRSARKVVTLVRDEIKLEEQEAKAKVIDLPAADGKSSRLGVIALPSFYAGQGPDGRVMKSATTDVSRLLKKLVAERVDGVVLDLRNNGGGSLDEAIRLTGLFIKSGPVVQIKDPDGTVRASADPDPSIAYDGPLVVLVNRATASASEILAGALQDYGRAVVVGDRSTFGKGTVQTIIPLGPVFRQAQVKTEKDPGAIKITVQKFYLPSGASTQVKGVVPDIILPSLMDEAEIGEGTMANALPWDTVPAKNLTSFNQVQPYLEALRKGSAARVAADRDFAYVREDIETYRKTVAAKQVSLNEAERVKARQEAEARLKARKEELAARPAPKEKVITVTLKHVDTPGLPPADPATTAPTAQVPAQETPAGVARPTGPDAVLEEGKRILADLIRLSRGQ